MSDIEWSWCVLQWMSYCVNS